MSDEFDEKAPITWVIAQIHDVVGSGAIATATAIAETITPLVSICFGIYAILMAVNYMRGAESEPVMGLMLRVVGFCLVVGIGLNMANYADFVVPIVTGLGSDLASVVSGGGVSVGTLDKLALYYLEIVDKGYQSAHDVGGLDGVGVMVLFVLKAAIVMLGLVPFLVLATALLVIADVGSIMVASVGPLFFAALIFPATRQYFSAWLNTMVSYALIPLLVAVVAIVSISISQKILLIDGGTLADVSFKRVFLVAIGNLILLFLLRQVNALASSLSAGGINVAQPGSLRAGARNMGSAAGIAAKAGGVAAILGFQGACGAYQLGVAARNRLGNGGEISEGKPQRKPG